ncbi:MAG: hypothetical protein Q8R79_05015 [Legionellaceae bacterium]|nr:hypothetical protein [Legionellaceae bacterium]
MTRQKKPETLPTKPIELLRQYIPSLENWFQHLSLDDQENIALILSLFMSETEPEKEAYTEMMSQLFAYSESNELQLAEVIDFHQVHLRGCRLPISCVKNKTFSLTVLEENSMDPYAVLAQLLKNSFNGEFVLSAAEKGRYIHDAHTRKATKQPLNTALMQQDITLFKAILDKPEMSSEKIFPILQENWEETLQSAPIDLIILICSHPKTLSILNIKPDPIEYLILRLYPQQNDRLFSLIQNISSNAYYSSKQGQRALTETLTHFKSLREPFEFLKEDTKASEIQAFLEKKTQVLPKNIVKSQTEITAHTKPGTPGISTSPPPVKITTSESHPAFKKENFDNLQNIYSDIDNAMTAAINACRSSKGPYGGARKVSDLEFLQLHYQQAANNDRQASLKAFLHRAATERKTFGGFFQKEYAGTGSIKGFYKALSKEAQEYVHSLLAESPISSSSNRAETQQDLHLFKTQLQHLKTEMPDLTPPLDPSDF